MAKKVKEQKRGRSLNKILRDELLRMVRDDQAMRRGIAYDARVDRAHVRSVKRIIKKYGWPGISFVGKSGAKGVWLLVQHADHDIRFQKMCLGLLRRAAMEGEAEKKYVAYLTDRVLKNTHHPQRFGTQFYLNRKGVMEPWRIAEKEDLGKRRKEFGLGSFSKYRKIIRDAERRFSKKKPRR